MARTSSGFSQALIYLEIIKRLPRHWVTSTEIMQSLKKIADLKGDLTVYPGHDRFSSLDFERANNPFLNRA